MSFASRTASSLPSGEKWHTVLLTETHVGKPTPLSIFLFTFLYMFPVCLIAPMTSFHFLNIQYTEVEKTMSNKKYILSDKSVAFLAEINDLGFGFALRYHQLKGLCTGQTISS